MDREWLTLKVAGEGDVPVTGKGMSLLALFTTWLVCVGWQFALHELSRHDGVVLLGISIVSHSWLFLSLAV